MTATNKVKKTKNSASFKSHHSIEESKKSSKSSYDRANIFSRLYCWYIFSFLYRNYNKDFYLDEIDVVAKEDSCERLGNKLRRYWNKELERKKASLLRAILWSFGPLFLLTNVYNFLVYGVLRMVMPMILGRIIFYSNEYFKETVNNTLIVNSENSSVHFIPSHNFSQSATTTTTSKNEQFDLFIWLNIILSNRQSVIAYSGLLALVILVNVCISHPYFFRQFRYGMHIRVAVSRLIFEKAMRVSTNSVQRNTIGKIVNLVSNDANRFDIAYIYVGFVYCALLETTVGIFFMYQYIGLSSFGTLAIVMAYIPFQTIMANILSKFRSKSIILTDNRLRLMAEILPAMRVIKMYGWEKSFSKLVNGARKLEITKIRHSMILRSINLALYFVAPKIMAFSCLLIYLIFDKEAKLSAENVFVTMALVAQIRDVITYMFPLGISYSVESYISIQRIQKFLLETEVTERSKSLPSTEIDQSCKEPRITLKNVTVTSDEGIPILQNLSFESVPKKLTVIIGSVGSGKSSILLSILNELTINSGSVDVRGKMIYASQEAWIFNGTVRENIIFGKEFDSVRYREVVRMAALTKDFQQFEDNDQTVVDDRGTSLSGGQRARISLARALYTDSDCYLLDDPLSAVDSSVSKHIFEKCIKEYLRNKCVILVTHQLQFIKQADQIVVLKDGACLACGSYTDLLSQGIDVFKYSVAEQEKPEALSQCPDTPSSPPILKNPALLRFRVDSFNSDIFRTSRTNSFIESEHDGVSVHDQVSILEYLTMPDGINLNEAKKLPHNMESNESGSKNKLKIYKMYISAGAGLLLFLTFLTSNILTQGLFTGSDYWLSLWTDHEEKLQIEQETNVIFERNLLISDDRNINILIYSCIVGLLFIMSIVRTTSFFVIAMRASVNLHNKIFSSLIQAPIVFFDKTPVGVIMNRISRDLGIIDDLLPPTAFEALEILGNSLAIFILCSILNWFVVPPFVVLMILIYLASRFYVNTARKLKRLEGVARSPLFNQLACSLTGLPTIRSYNMQQLFIERFNDTQDVHTATYFAFISASRLYGIFLENICVVYIFSLLTVININLDAYTGSVIGLTISQVLAICNTFNWGIRQMTEVETYMTSVERVAEFGELDKEELDKCKQEPDTKWPWRGEIVYKNVSLVYNAAANLDDIDEPPKKVLSQLSFHIRGGEKIGIVGRTGAGKSSLITTLFRLTQPTGQIFIDNIDTAETSLARLRKGLAIIPQEPILFSGTIRRNLDPFCEKSDEEIWDAIEKVQLKTKIQSFPSKLDSSVSDCGSDFSVGQKQLICLARAILRRSPILILDECTANCDPRTDSLIQQTIRTEFGPNTVLTIAHRLNTIIDYDRVMVLDAGSLAQFDSPYELIKQRSGIFYELYSSLNPDTKVELKRMALKAYAEKQQTQL